MRRLSEGPSRATGTATRRAVAAMKPIWAVGSPIALSIYTLKKVMVTPMPATWRKRTPAINTIKPVGGDHAGSTAGLCPYLQRLIFLGVTRLKDDNEGHQDDHAYQK